MTRQNASNLIRTVQGLTAELDSWPIPKEQIISGDPRASGRFLWQSEDKRLGNGVWEVTPGSFTGETTWDETSCIIDGEATITEVGGISRKYRAGDLIFFPVGARFTWDVTKTVRKAFHVNSPTPVEI